MRKEDILNVAPRLLTDRQRREYFERGFLTITDIISKSWVEKLQSTSQKFFVRAPLRRSLETYMIWVQIIPILSPTLDV